NTHISLPVSIFSLQFVHMKNLLFVLFILLGAGWMSCSPQKASDDAAATTTADTTKAMAPAEFADQKYADMGKKLLAEFAAGDIEGYMSNFADNAVYHWNNGDSIVGKAAISDYWKKRRADVIDSISFTNAIYLPVIVNKPQALEAK